MKMEYKINPNLHKKFRALSNPVRLEIFLKIVTFSNECKLAIDDRHSDNCVTKIADKLDLGQPTVSNHVKELVNAGLIIQEKRGKNIYLFVARDVAEDFKVFSAYLLKRN